MVATVEADAKLTPRGCGVRVAVAAGNGLGSALPVWSDTMRGVCLSSRFHGHQGRGVVSVRGDGIAAA